MLCRQEGFCQDLTLPRAIKLGEEESSPAAEEKFPLFEEEEGLLSCENGFDMGVGVPFTVVEVRVRGNESGEVLLGIGYDVGVPGFVDVQAASRVGHKKKKQPGTPFGEQPGCFFGYMNRLHPSGGANGKPEGQPYSS